MQSDFQKHPTTVHSFLRRILPVLTALLMTSSCSVMLSQNVPLIAPVTSNIASTESLIGTSFLKVWNFSPSSAPQYSLGSSSVLITGNKAQLGYVNQWDLDNAAEGFSGGSHSDTRWNLSRLELAPAGQAAKTGSFVSRIMDAGTPVNWTQLSWYPIFPALKEIHDGGANEYGYLSGNLSAAGLFLLAHLNGPLGKVAHDSAVTESSGVSGNGFALNNNNEGLAFLEGKLNQGMRFDGADDALAFPHKSAQLAYPLTISTWVRFSGAISGPIVSKYSSASTSGYQLSVSSGALCAFYYRNAVSYISDDTACPLQVTGYNDGQWHHVALVVGSAGGNLYVDGVSKKTRTWTGTPGATTETSAIYLGTNASGSEHLSADLDEVALWSRTFSATEIADLYRRGSTRIKLQVRSCASPSCASATWLGPDGSASTFYSELHNRYSAAPVVDLIGIPANRYFQYRVFLETDGGGNFPALDGVIVGPSHRDASGPSVALVSNSQGFRALSSFSVAMGSGNAGAVRFQLSPNGSEWYYWNGTKWALATSSGFVLGQSNSASSVDANISRFSSDAGTGRLYFKAFLVSNGSQHVELHSVQITGLE